MIPRSPLRGLGHCNPAWWGLMNFDTMKSDMNIFLHLLRSMIFTKLNCI